MCLHRGEACIRCRSTSLHQKLHFKQLSLSCRNLASKGFSFWGENNDSPNSVLNWDMACGYFNSTNSSSFVDSFSLMGSNSPGEVDGYFPHGVGSGSLRGVSVQFFKDANGQQPVFYASEAPPVPDLTKVTTRAVDFQPALGGVHVPCRTGMCMQNPDSITALPFGSHSAAWQPINAQKCYVLVAISKDLCM